MNQHCTTDGYGNTGCIGTAVEIHSTGVLPYSGFELAWIVGLVIAVIAGGVLLRFSERVR